MISEDPRLPYPVKLTRLRRSCRLRLRVDHERRLLRLTMPWRSSAKAALDWVAGQGAWIERQLRSAPPSSPFEHGREIPFRGRILEICHEPGARRGVRLVDDRLHVGGPVEGLAGAVERWLKAQARDILSAETARIAGAAGVTVRSVSIGDAGSRWGSCSSTGVIRYSWRLILAPPEVLRFVVAHEVAHRLHMDHSTDFRAAEQRLFGRPVADARLELRRLGPALRAVGRH